jgi:hypothetical protein
MLSRDYATSHAYDDLDGSTGQVLHLEASDEETDPSTDPSLHDVGFLEIDGPGTLLGTGQLGQDVELRMSDTAQLLVRGHEFLALDPDVLGKTWLDSARSNGRALVVAKSPNGRVMGTWARIVA